MKYLIHLLLVSFFLGCCKSEHTFKPLAEEDKDWLPYNEGDSLFFYHGDILVESSKISIGKGKTFNKRIEGCGAATEQSETDKILLDSLQNIANFPVRFEVGYNSDKLVLGDFYDSDNAISPFSGWLEIKSASAIDLIINGKEYKNVKVLTNQNDISPITYYIKEGVGLLQVISYDNKTFEILRK